MVLSGICLDTDGLCSSHQVDTFAKKCKATHLDARTALMVENALLATNPPPAHSQSAAAKERKRTALELYIENLLTRELTPRSVEKVLRCLRSLPWNKTLELPLWRAEKYRL